MIVSSWQEQVSADSAPGALMDAPTQDVWRALESKGGMAMVGPSSIPFHFYKMVLGFLATLFWMLLMFLYVFGWFSMVLICFELSWGYLVIL